MPHILQGIKRKTHDGFQGLVVACGWFTCKCAEGSHQFSADSDSKYIMSLVLFKGKRNRRPLWGGGGECKILGGYLLHMPQQEPWL